MNERKGPTFGLLEEDDEALTQHRCVGCDIVSPPTRTAYTLIGKAHGWRVTRLASPSGAWIFEWHCPSCWAARPADADADGGADR